MWNLAANAGPYMISRNVLPKSNLITRYTMRVRLLDVMSKTRKRSKNCMQMQYFNNIITDVQETRKPQIRKRELNWRVSRLYEKNTLQILSNPRQRLIMLSFMNRQAKSYVELKKIVHLKINKKEKWLPKLVTNLFHNRKRVIKVLNNKFSW